MKKIYALIAAVVVLAAASVAIIVNAGKPDSFFEANVEALADVESGGFGPMCSKTGTSGTYTMKLCSNCSGSFGHYAMDVVAFCQNR